ncbi:MAG TPA: universal stress protein [Anaerolineales bacterium]|nr:universal stress protein [Anaerolineales bacterium]
MVTNHPTEQETTEGYISAINILLAYDGSWHAQAAVNLLSSLDLGSRSTVTCLAVMGTQNISAHEALQNSLNDAGERLKESGVQVTTVLKAGNPAASINDWAELHDIDLTVIGAKGLRATLGILLGGVAQQVVEYSKSPVLVVRAPFEGLRKVLIVVDGSIHSQRALHCIAPPEFYGQCRFPLPADVDIRLVHVLPPSVPQELASRAWTVGPEVMYPVPARPVDWDKVEAEEETEGKKLLTDAMAPLQNCGLTATPILLRGDAATEILEYIKSHEIDLVVCGSRGLNPVTGWLLGSVSRKLVHYAESSILIVK